MCPPSSEPRAVLSRRAYLGGALALLALPPSAAKAQGATFPGRTWEAVDPQAFGWSPQGLQQAQAQFQSMGSTAIVVVQHGRLIAGWGDTNRPVKVHSVRKSFMSALYGIALAQGRVNLDWKLQDLRIDDLPPSLTPQEKQARVRDLLMARSGIYHEAAAETESMRRKRPQRGSAPPGTQWYYNNWDFNALGTILRNATGEDTFKAIEHYFARPLGMEHFTAVNGQYVTVRASEHPAYHMSFTARDLARFGWMFLNRGQWAGQQILLPNWVAESTRVWSPDARRGVGYGYMWWVAQNKMHFRTDMGPGAFSARGSGGQFIVVAPSRGIVIAHLNDQDENERLESGQFNTLMQAVFAAAPQ